MQEIFEPWHPEGKAINFCYMLSIADGGELSLVLSNEPVKSYPRVTISFDMNVKSYIALRGSIVMSVKKNLTQMYGEEFLKKSSCFKVKNSIYAQSASYQSCTVTELLGVEHFCIVTHTTIVHILSYYEPSVLHSLTKE